MLAMTLPTFYDEVYESAVHLPVGARLILPEVGWDDYERLVDEIDGERQLRITYDCGRMEIVSPGQTRAICILLRRHAANPQ